MFNQRKKTLCTLQLSKPKVAYFCVSRGPPTVDCSPTNANFVYKAVFFEVPKSM